MPRTPAYTEKCKPCLLCGMFGARLSSDTDHIISRKECVTVVGAWGSRWRRERYSGSGIAYCGLIASPVPVGEIEALLDHLDELGATVQRHLRRGAKSYIPFISQRLQCSASTL